MVAQTLKVVCPLSGHVVLCQYSRYANVSVRPNNELSPSGYHVHFRLYEVGAPLVHALHAQHEEPMEPIPDLHAMREAIRGHRRQSEPMEPIPN